MEKSLQVKQLFVELLKSIVACMNGADLSTLGVDQTRHAHIQIEGFVLEGPLAVKIFEVAAAAGLLVEDDFAWSKEAIFDLFSTRSIPFIEGRSSSSEITRASEEFLSALTKEPTDFEKLLSIFGLDNSISGFEFGEITIIRQQYKHYCDFEPLFKKDEPIDLHFAAVKVRTIDDQTARTKSQQLLNGHLAVINALISNIYPSSFRLTHVYTDPMDFCMVGFSAPNGKWGGSSMRHRVNLPIPEIMLKTVLETPVAMRASSLMISKSELANRIRAAYELVGNACNSMDYPTAFVLFAMALESSVMGGRTNEITYQLATRVAHLVADSVSDRVATANHVKKLYGIRSRIVHSGNTDVTREEVGQIRQLCLNVLAALSALAEKKGITGNKKLEEWFEFRTLESS